MRSLCILAIIAVSFFGLLLFTPAATAEGSEEVDLSAMMINATDISPDAVQLLDAEITAEDYLPDLPGTLLNQVKAHYRQGWGRTFQIGDLHAGVLLTEFHYNEYVRSDMPQPSMETPAGAPEDSRWELENGSVVHVTAPASRIKVEVFIRPMDSAATASVDDLTALAAEIVATQIEAVPPLTDLPPPAEALEIGRKYGRVLVIAAVVLVLLSVIVGASAATVRDRGSREWFRHSRHVTESGPHVVDLTNEIARRNRRQFSAAFGRVAGLAGGIAVLWSIPGLGTMSMLLILIAGLLTGNAVYMSVKWKSAERQGRPRLGWWIKALHYVGASLSLCLVVGGLGLLAAAAAAWFMIDDTTVRIIAVTFACMGLAGLSMSRGPSRFFRRLAQPAVRKVIDEDPRPRVLLLRSFQDDDLEVRGRASLDENLGESVAPEAYLLFEEVLAMRLWELGPVLAIGQPGTILQPLGAARDYHSDDEWQTAVEAVARDAALLVVVVGRSPGLMWEIENIRRRGRLAKTTFVLPPVPVKELQNRLRVLASSLDISVDAFDPGDHRFPLIVRFDDTGEPVLYSAAGRDDRAYEAALDRVVEDVMAQAPARLVGPALHWLRKSDDVSGLLETYDPRKRRRRRKTVGRMLADGMVGRF